MHSFHIAAVTNGPKLNGSKQHEYIPVQLQSIKVPPGGSGGESIALPFLFFFRGRLCSWACGLSSILKARGIVSLLLLTLLSLLQSLHGLFLL